MQEFMFSGRKCRTETFGNAKNLVVLLSGYSENSELYRVLNECFSDTQNGFLLAEFEIDDWDKDYSPWKFTTEDGRIFSGEAEKTLEFIEMFVDELKKKNGDFEGLYLVGYSLGGLCALYCQSKLHFDGVGSCSGSLWFPNFLDYAASSELSGKVFLSLGGKEKNTEDKLLLTVEDCTNEFVKICKTMQSVKSVVFVHEHGGHFTKIPQRIAKCIEWLVN